MAEVKETNYTQGYSKATLASHASRTVDSDASFLIPHIKPTDKILDVGCGPGSITTGIAALVPQGSVTGVDISEEVLNQARASHTATNMTFQKGDLLAGLPFPDDTFDVVFSSQLFPHLATLEMRQRALGEMRRIVKKGGILATRDAAELHCYPVNHKLDQLWTGNMIKALRDGTDDARWPGGDMPALFRQVGFEKIKIGAGTTVHADEEVRRWFADAGLGKLKDGDTFRESWRGVGITDEEVERTREALKAWAADEDAWYAALQAEILGWK